MAAALLSRFKQRLSALELVPGSGGCFEVEADGEVFYSKLQEGVFPEESHVIRAVEQRLSRN